MEAEVGQDESMRRETMKSLIDFLEGKGKRGGEGRGVGGRKHPYHLFMSAFRNLDQGGDKAQPPSEHEVSHHWKSIPWSEVLSQNRKADRMFLRSGLIRKDQLPKFAAQDHPSTRVISNIEDLNKAINDDNDESGGASGDQCYVFKPADSSNAHGLYLIPPSLDEARASMTLDPGPRVLQPYIRPHLLPLATGLHKYHLRALTLISGDLTALLYDEIRVLIAPVPFSWQNMSEPNAHVTNQSFNKSHPDYEEGTHNVALHECGALGNGDPRQEFGGGIYHKIKMICQRLFRRLGADRRRFLSLPNTYELFGLDFLVDEGGRVWLLEANPEPSLGMFGRSRQEVEGENVLGVVGGGGCLERFEVIYRKDVDRAMERMKEVIRKAKESGEIEPRGGGEKKKQDGVVGLDEAKETGGEEVD